LDGLHLRLVCCSFGDHSVYFNDVSSKKHVGCALKEEFPYHLCLTRRGVVNVPVLQGLEGLASGTPRFSNH